MNATSKTTIRTAAIRTATMLRLSIASSPPLVFVPDSACNEDTLPAEESDAAARQPLPRCPFKKEYVTDHASTHLSAGFRSSGGRTPLPSPSMRGILRREPLAHHITRGSSSVNGRPPVPSTFSCHFQACTLA